MAIAFISISCPLLLLPSSLQVHPRSSNTSSPCPNTLIQLPHTQSINLPPPFPIISPPLPAPTVVWFRHDLRLHDNPALFHSSKRSPIAPVFILPPSPSAFLLASLRHLRGALRRIGTDLHIRQCSGGNATEAVLDVARFVGAGAVAYGGAMKEKGLETGEMEVRWYEEGEGLYSCKELPFALADLPSECDEFARRMRDVKINEVDETKWARGVQGLSPGEELDWDDKMEGGEARGIERVRKWIGGGRVCERGERVETVWEGLTRYLEWGCISVRWAWRRVVTGESLRRYCGEWELTLFEYNRLVKLSKSMHRCDSHLTQLTSCHV